MIPGTRGRALGWARSWVVLGILVAAQPGFAHGEAPSSRTEIRLQAARAAGTVVADTLPVSLDSIPALLLVESRRGDARLAILERGRTASGPEATLWLELYSVVEEVSPESGSRAARALLVVASSEGTGRAPAVLAAETEGVPEEDRPAILAFAALLLQGDDPESAAVWWERVLEEFPDSPRAMEATLYAARHRADAGADRDGAVTMLEEMIVAAPNHPLSAEARRLLARIRETGG
ncbi:MAG: hypothetical protein WD960_12190 [Gemmatimonadota bacterium]